MPKEIKDFEKFTSYLSEKAPSKANKNKKQAEHKPKTVFKKKLILKHVHKNGKKILKLKLRTKGQLFTHIVKSEEVAKKMIAGLPPSIEKIDLSAKNNQKKKAGK